MAKVHALVVYDELGNISSVSRPTEHERIKVIVLSGSSESVLRVEINEEAIPDMIRTHRVNVDQNVLVEYSSQE